jgi:DnaJ family protein C protein 13
MQALHTAFERCVPMVSTSSEDEDLPVRISTYLCRCFATAAQFESCREKFTEMSLLFGNLCRLLQFPVRSDYPFLSTISALVPL